MQNNSRWLDSKTRGIRHLLGFSVASGEVSGLLLIGQTWLMAFIVSSIVIAGRPVAAMAGYFALFAATIPLRFALTWGARKLGHSLANKVKIQMRNEIALAIVAAGPEALSRMKTGEISSVAVDAVESVDDYYSGFLPQRMIAMILPVTILVVIFPLDWISALILTATAVFLPITMILIGSEALERNRAQWGLISRLNSRFLDILQGLPTLKAFGASKREVEVLAQSSHEYRHATMAVLRIAFLSSFALELLAALSIAIVAVVTGIRLLHGSMDFGRGYFVLLIAPEYFMTLRSLGTFYHSRMQAASAAEKIRVILDATEARGVAAAGGVEVGGGGAGAPPGAPSLAAAPEFSGAATGVHEGSGARADRTIAAASEEAKARAGSEGASLEGKATQSPQAARVTAIELRPISVRFESVSLARGSRQIFHNLNLDVPAGSTLVLKGKSGVGKTSILTMILGFTQLDAGRIVLEDGHGLWLCRQVATVPVGPQGPAASAAGPPGEDTPGDPRQAYLRQGRGRAHAPSLAAAAAATSSAAATASHATAPLAAPLATHANIPIAAPASIHAAASSTPTLNANLAWLPQKPTLFSETIAWNIRLGSKDATDDQVREAARKSQALAFIENTKMGFDTRIGEGGQNLSSGQAQRIALARIFLANADLVLLDEPTAYLDPLGESLVLEALADYAKGRTLIVATHRDLPGFGPILELHASGEYGADNEEEAS